MAALFHLFILSLLALQQLSEEVREISKLQKEQIAKQAGLCLFSLLPLFRLGCLLFESFFALFFDFFPFCMHNMFVILFVVLVVCFVQVRFTILIGSLMLVAFAFALCFLCGIFPDSCLMQIFFLFVFVLSSIFFSSDPNKCRWSDCILVACLFPDFFSRSLFFLCFISVLLLI